MAARPPIALGPFDLLAPVAQGSSAEIWRAVHRTRRTPLAVKVLLPPPIDQRADALRLFSHEVRAVANLEHPGIVRIHDFGTVPSSDDPRLPGGSPYLVMEWIEGGTLGPHAGQLDWSALRRTLLALLDALAHAHARGIVHRDIKAANVLCSARGPILTDFGIALTAEHADDDAHALRLLGTPDYMAPEQAAMQQRRIGPWTDLYALGCLAFELVAGYTPFAGRNIFQVLRAQTDQPPPPLMVRDDIPPAFSNWVRRLLDKQPERRYRFAAHAAADLRALPGPAPSVVLEPRDPLSTLPLPGTGQALFALREAEVAGRAAERARLRGLLDAVLSEGRARLALIEGPSASGKSRLAVWLGRWAHAEGRADALWATHTAEAHGAGEGGDGPAPMLLRHLRCADLDGEDRLDHLLERLGDEDLAWGLAAAAEPDGRFALDARVVLLGSHAEIDEALCRVLARLTAEAPLVLTLDNGQWAEDGLRLVGHLLDHHPELPVLVLVPVALDRVPPAMEPRLATLRAHPLADTLTVGPLGPEALAESLRARIPLDEGLVAELVRRAAGSPVFAEEMVRHWLRTDALVERGGALVLKAGAEASLPEGMAAMWRARLAEELRTLGPDGRRALEAAAVVGGAVELPVWRQVADVDLATLDAAREHLLDARLAVAQGRGAWSFAHPMLREVLLDAARREGRSAALHRRCALALQLRGAEPSHIAEHLLGAGDRAAAVPVLFEAARRARRRHDLRAMHRELMRLARALGALRRPYDAPERIELRILWAQAEQSGKGARAARRHAQRAAHQAHARGDHRLVASALLAIAGSQERSKTSLIRWMLPAWQAAERSGDAEMRWRASRALAFEYVKRGRFDDAVAMLETLRGMLDGQTDDIQRGDLYRLETLLARGRGRFDEARVAARRAAAYYAQSGSRIKQAHGYNLLGDLARYAGAFEEAADAYRQAVRFAELAGSSDSLIDELNLGAVLLETREFAEARRRLTAVVQRATRMRFHVAVLYGHLCLLVCETRDRRWSAWDTRWRAIAPIREGQLIDIDAARIAEVVARLAIRRGSRSRSIAAWRLAADTYRRLGQLERAEEAARRADALEAGEGGASIDSGGSMSSFDSGSSGGSVDGSVDGAPGGSVDGEE